MAIPQFKGWFCPAWRRGSTSASVANILTGYVLGMKTCACALECLVVMIQCKAPWPTFHKSFNFVCVWCVRVCPE